MRRVEGDRSGAVAEVPTARGDAVQRTHRQVRQLQVFPEAEVGRAGAEIRIAAHADDMFIHRAAGTRGKAPVHLRVAAEQVRDDIARITQAKRSVEPDVERVRGARPLDAHVMVEAVFDVTRRSKRGHRPCQVVRGGMVHIAVRDHRDVVVSGIPSVLVGIELHRQRRTDRLIADAATRHAGGERVRLQREHHPVGARVATAEHDGEVVVERIAEVDALLVPDRAVLRAGRLGKPVAVAGNGGSRSAALELCRCRDGSKREKNPDAVKKKFSQV